MTAIAEITATPPPARPAAAAAATSSSSSSTAPSSAPSRARPTMKDIADRVGTSIKTVSRVLNGEPGVSTATAERILSVAQELGFRRNDLARNLRRGDRTESIGLVLRSSATRFYDSLIRGVQEVADEHGALVLTATSRTPQRERAALLALSSRRVDGLLVVPTGEDQAYLRPEQAAGLPLVFVDRPPVGVRADAVLTDDAGGARIATEHLIGYGHRRIGVLGASARVHTVQERVRGHQGALARTARRTPGHQPAADAALDGSGPGRSAPDGLVRLNCVTAEDATAAALDLLRGAEGLVPPTAVFALNSRCTIGAARALRQLGRSHDVALVGFDDFELSDLLDPPVTVVGHDVVEMGRVAARRLFARMTGDDGEPQRVVLPTTLVARGSGELPAGGAG